MSIIQNAKAFANNEVGYLAWEVKAMIPGCVGFELTRIYINTGERSVLAAWVSFKGQSNPDWKPQNTSVWPIQKLSWRDLTLRKRRDDVATRPDDDKVKYLIRPLVKQTAQLEKVVPGVQPDYTGTPIPLSYVDEGMETNEVMVTATYNDITTTFTNGILSTQWLSHALKKAGLSLSVKSVIDTISKPGNNIREYLTGDVLGTLRYLLVKASQNPGSKVRLALYELSDKELIDLLIANKKSISIILSNTSKGKDGWDETNLDARKALHDAQVDITDRMFNNAHIGHNKFAVYLDKDGKPQEVLSGSTNWTSTGLCAQSNNAIQIRSAEIAKEYNTYWERLLADTKAFTKASNVQGPALRAANIADHKTFSLSDGTNVAIWYSPNTLVTTVNKEKIPPDLSEVYQCMRKVDKAIFFAVFLPGLKGNVSIIQEAIDIGTKDNSVFVYGSISDPMAMPNYIVPPKKTNDGNDGEDGTPDDKPHIDQPTTFIQGRTRIVRAFNLNQQDLVGDFEAELLKVGHAIIHDKIIVVDPHSDKGVVILGSHNLGYKASYANDENLIIIRNNKTLVQAYAAHLLDIWEHYRFRAVQEEMELKHKKGWDGYLSLDDAWLAKRIAGEKEDISNYICENF